MCKQTFTETPGELFLIAGGRCVGLHIDQLLVAIIQVFQAVVQVRAEPKIGGASDIDGIIHTSCIILGSCSEAFVPALPWVLSWF